jgi:hypothetical protein
VWNAAKREYEVASHAERIATKSLKRAARSSGADTLDALATIGSVGVGVLAGPAAGIESKVALSALKYLAPRGWDSVQGAIARVGRSSVPKFIADDVSLLAKQQAQTAAAAESRVAVMAPDDATREYLNLYGDLLEAQSVPMPRQYRAKLDQARERLEQGYLAARPLTAGGGPYDTDALGDAIEEARNIFSTASVPTTRMARAHITESSVRAQREAFGAMRDLRDKFTAQLGRPDAMWGAKRAERSVDELRRLQRVYADPALTAQIQTLAEQTGAIRKVVSDKGSRLMGFVAPVSQLKSQRDKRKRQQEFAEEVQKNTLENSVMDELPVAEAP